MYNSVPNLHRSIVPLILSALLLLILLAMPQRTQALTEPAASTRADPPAHAGTTYGIGEPVAHVKCEPGYTTSLYARGLRSPDGLAFSPAGVLHVAEETGKRVSQIGPNGSITPVLGDLKSPEDIAFDDAGNLYVVEDARRGRLIQMTPDGQVTTLADNLEGPEGITITPDGTLHVTESNIQFVINPYALRTQITVVSAPGDVRRLTTQRPILNGSMIAFWSYAEIATGPDGRFYVTNELSSKKITRKVVLVPDVLTYTVTLLTNDSVFAVDPATGTRTVFASGLITPEGLSFSADGGFPLYVAEEIGQRAGRLSRVGPEGQHTVVCSGFRGIEDVTVDPQGNLYVSEDGSGSVIRIYSTHSSADNTPGAKDTAEPPAQANSGAAKGADQAAAPDTRTISLVHAIQTRITRIVRRITRSFRSLRVRSALNGESSITNAANVNRKSLCS